MYSKLSVQTPDNCKVDDEKNDMLGKPILRHRDLSLGQMMRLSTKNRLRRPLDFQLFETGMFNLLSFCCLLQIMPNPHFDDLGIPVWRNHQHELPSNRRPEVFSL